MLIVHHRYRLLRLTPKCLEGAVQFSFDELLAEDVQFELDVVLGNFICLFRRETILAHQSTRGARGVDGQQRGLAFVPMVSLAGRLWMAEKIASVCETSDSIGGTSYRPLTR